MIHLKRVVGNKLSPMARTLMLLSCLSLLPYARGNGQTFVQTNGKLSVMGKQLVNQDGLPVQLRGMSSSGTSWYPLFINERCIKWLVDDWKITVYRAAMLTDPSPHWKAYIDDPAPQKEYIKTAVDAAVKLGIYVIIDWHDHAVGNPNTYKQQAKDFFREMAKLYGQHPNVIYEIYNEPFSDTLKWTKYIKPYAEEILSAIRAEDPDNLVLVGTSGWSQGIHEAADNPLADKKVFYVCHFYAGTHGQYLRDRITYCMNKNVPVFVSEWGMSDYTGGDDGKIYLSDTKKWLSFLDSNKISWINWQICDKPNHSSAALKPGAATNGNWKDADLSESGIFVRNVLRTANQTASKPPQPNNPSGKNRVPVIVRPSISSGEIFIRAPEGSLITMVRIHDCKGGMLFKTASAGSNFITWHPERLSVNSCIVEVRYGNGRLLRTPYPFIPR